MEPGGIAAYLIDRDGVLTASAENRPLPGAVDWLRRLRSAGVPFLIATNHTLSSPGEAAQGMAEAGFPVTEADFHTPLTIVMEYLKERDPGRVLVLGTDPLKRFFLSKGLELTEEPQAGTVVMGFCRTMDHCRLSCAVEAIHTYGARLIALHENHIFRNDEGRYEAGLGAWVKALETATGVRALIVGKPNGYYYESALTRLGVPAERAVMISDDPFGDLGGAKRVGMRTVWVMSGKYPDRAILSDIPEDLCPDEVFAGIAEVPIQ